MVAKISARFALRVASNPLTPSRIEAGNSAICASENIALTDRPKAAPADAKVSRPSKSFDAISRNFLAGMPISLASRSKDFGFTLAIVASSFLDGRRGHAGGGSRVRLRKR